MTAPLLSVSNLTKAFGGLKAVDAVSFDVHAGELLALIGPNGAGKTTCFSMLNGQLRADSGSVRFESLELIGLKPREVWRLGVGRTFQIAATFSSLTVRENVQMALLSHAQRLFDWRARASDAYVARANELLDLVGMRDQADRACSVLAYGDIKRLELAIALANKPRLLLMDEPTAGMAPRERVELMALTADIARRESMAVLFTEHDMDVVFTHAERLIVLSRGHVIAQGAPAAVRADPEVQRVYLGSRSEH